MAHAAMYALLYNSYLLHYIAILFSHMMMRDIILLLEIKFNNSIYVSVIADFDNSYSLHSEYILSCHFHGYKHRAHAVQKRCFARQNKHTNGMRIY